MPRKSRNEQKGGATPLPLPFFTGPGQSCDFYKKQVIYNQCGHPISYPDQPAVKASPQSGGTPYPLAYFDPTAESRPGYKYVSVHSPAKCGYFAKSNYVDMLYRSDEAKKKAVELAQAEESEQQGGGCKQTCGLVISPLPAKYLDLNRHLNTLGNNAEVINRDNLRRLYKTYKKVHGFPEGVEPRRIKMLFSYPSYWAEFANADYVVGQLLEIIHQRLTGSYGKAVEKAQQGGNAVGAPFFIPNYGLNPNLASGQMDEESQATTGYSYQFKTGPPCTPFGSLWGSNLPTFNPVCNQ